MMSTIERPLSYFRTQACVFATMISFTSVAAAQGAAEQEALSRNCVAISIDQCYRDGLIRLINNIFLPQISSILSSDQKNTLKSVKFMVVADRDALGASAGYANGSAVIRVTSSVNYHIALFANAAALSIFSEKDLSTYTQYQEKAVAVLVENTRRARLGQSLLPTPSYAAVEGLDEMEVAELMKNDTFLGLNAYFTQVMTFWVLAHEVGHQVLRHPRAIADSPGIPRKKMEAAADDFAARALVKMGYSVYPTIFLMGYFAAVEESGNGSPDNYPPTVCRLANVFSSAWSERDGSGTVGPRDTANRKWNEVMDQPALRRKIESVLNGPQCRS